MIYTVTLNPALDKTAQIHHLTPGQVNRISALRTDPGGKGINVSKTIRALGGESTVVALLAGQCGRQVAAGCERLGLRCRFTFAPGETRTNLKIVDPDAGTTTDINEPGPEVSPKLLDGMLEELLERIGKDDIVVMSGSLPVGAPPCLYRRWTERCREKGAKVILDAEGEPLLQAIPAGPWLVKPNRAELAALAGREMRTTGDILSAARAIQAKGARQVVVSLGEAGALFLLDGGAALARAPQVSAVSTVGAGDAMVAALALGEDRGLAMDETVRSAIAVSAASVTCDGTQAADPAMVRALLPQVSWERLGQ